MKIIRNLNLFAIGLPITILITYPIFKEGALVFALLSSILTGFIQVIIGLVLIFSEPSNRFLQIYIVSVIAFFAIWYINAQIGYNSIVNYCLFPIPILLAIYLTIIIHKKTIG
jgi:hypothetical protein